MKIISFFKAVLDAEIPMPPGESEDLVKALKDDYDSIQWSPDYQKEVVAKKEKFPVKFYFKKYAENPYVRLGLAFFYLVTLKWIRDFKNPQPDSEGKSDHSAY